MEHLWSMGENGPYVYVLTYRPSQAKHFAGMSFECDSDGWHLSGGVRGWRAIAVGWFYRRSIVETTTVDWESIDFASVDDDDYLHAHD